MLRLNSIFFHLCPLLPAPSVGTTRKSLAPLSSFVAIRREYTLTKCPWASSSMIQWLNSHCSLSLSTYKRCFNPLLIFVILCRPFGPIVVTPYHHVLVIPVSPNKPIYSLYIAFWNVVGDKKKPTKPKSTTTKPTTKSIANEKKKFKKILHFTYVHFFVFVFHPLNERLGRRQEQHFLQHAQIRQISEEKLNRVNHVVHVWFISYRCTATLIQKKAVRQCYRSCSWQLTKSTVQGTLVKMRKSRKQFTTPTICAKIHQNILNGHSGVSMHKEK